MSPTSLRWAARTDVGRARDRNEDSYFGGDHVFAVADGLGGHNAGDVASRIAIEPIKALDGRIDGVRPDRVADMLVDTVNEANRAVYKRAQADAKVRGMGTTLTAVAITDGSAHIAHVGDSRCYLFRAGAMSQLSSDHTLVARMVQEGKLTSEQAEVHPQRSILTRALGAESDVEVDSLEIALIPGDRLLLCSDGLSSVIAEDLIRAVLADSPDIEAASVRLIDEANAHGGPDNITVVVVEVTGSAPARASAEIAAPARSGVIVGEVRRAGRRRIPARPIIWSLVAVLVLLGVWIGLRSWVDRSYYVGVSAGKVAIFRGLPADVAGLDLHHVEQSTDLSIDQVASYFRRNLQEGIRVKSLDAARKVVASIPRTDATPSPGPSPTPAKT